MTKSMFGPNAGLLCKLGSIVVHADELMSADGHEFDRIALGMLLTASEVKAWLAEMDKMGMVPKKREP